MMMVTNRRLPQKRLKNLINGASFGRQNVSILKHVRKLTKKLSVREADKSPNFIIIVTNHHIIIPMCRKIPEKYVCLIRHISMIIIIFLSAYCFRLIRSGLNIIWKKIITN